jgi:cytoskeletal protein RodZ
MEDLVKNRLHALTFVATLAVALLGWSGLLNAQSQPQDQQSTPQSQQTSPSQDPQQATPQSQQAPADQTQPQQTPNQQAPDSQSQTQSQQSAEGQTFTGTVVKSGDKYVLQDAASGTTYDIDHQDEVKKFEGKKVKVHGTLDASGKMIHVQ